MKINNPNKKTITQATVMGVGAGVGVGVGRITNDYFPEDKQTSGFAKIAVAVALIAGASAIASTDTLSSASKGLLAGAAGEKILSGTADLLADTEFATPKDDDDSITKMSQLALGMRGSEACGCTTQHQVKPPVLALPQLRFPSNYKSSRILETTETKKNDYKEVNLLR